ncbi:MAG: D-lactate dehydrogenase, partial [Deinococcota bacterium]
SIKYLGTERLPKLYAFKAKVEYLLNKIPFLPKYIPDMILYYASQFFPPHLPKRLREYQAKYQHYLILSMTDEGIDEARQYLADEWSKTNDVGYFECTEEEQEAALLHRFSAAGAGLRYQNMHQGSTEEMLALDIARLSNDPDWIEELPEDISKDLDIALYYGHYMCHVFHNTYIFKKGTDVAAMKTKLLAMLESKGAKYPAEHNVGHMYEAEQVLKEFYAKLDPTNTFNPGIGKTDKRRPVMFT